MNISVSICESPMFYCQNSHFAPIWQRKRCFGCQNNTKSPEIVLFAKFEISTRWKILGIGKITWFYSNKTGIRWHWQVGQIVFKPPSGVVDVGVFPLLFPPLVELLLNKIRHYWNISAISPQPNSTTIDYGCLYCGSNAWSYGSCD